MNVTRTILLLAAAALACAARAAQQPKLPEPFATPSANNSARVIPKPEGAQLKVPDGFRVSVFADNLDGPRTMLYAPNGDIFIAQSRAGSVVILRDGIRYVYAQGLNGVF